MTVVLSTPFEAALVAGPYGFTSLNHGENITQDSSVQRHGTYSMKVIGNTGFGVFASRGVTQRQLAGRVYIYVPVLPAASIRFIKAAVGATDFHIFLNPNGRLQHSIGSTDGVSPGTVISAATWYLVDFLFNSTGTTYTADFKLSDTNGALLTTATQLTKTGQTAADMTVIQLGQMNQTVDTIYFDDITCTDQAADYPLGPGVGNDGSYPPITVYPPSWLDEPARISGGVLFGMMTQNLGVGDNGQALLSESASKALRPNYILGSYYSDVTAVPDLTLERQFQTGTMLGHQAWPMIHPFGFSGANTTHWPSGGLADFTSGSLDSVLSTWCSTMNTQLGHTPFFIRPFREMQSQGVMWGSNGAANGGVNETPASFIAAWRHIVTYIRARCPMARFVWCPDVTTTPTVSYTWYPGDAYVDWVGVDAYATSGNGYDAGIGLTTWYAAFNPSNGTLGLKKPIGICETSVQAADPNRITDFQRYTALLEAMPDFGFAVLWDSAPAGPYYVSDSPIGFLPAFQRVVGSPPFLASLDTGGIVDITAADTEATTVTAADSETTVITLGVAA